MELEILKDWGEVVAVNKPAGWITIPGRGNKEGIPILSHKVGELLRGAQKRQGRDLYVVHRLDEGTSGVILFTKTAEAHKILSQSFEQGLVKKTYWALVGGHFPQNLTMIDAPLFKLPSKRNKSIVDVKGKPSKTGVSVCKSKNGLTWVKAHPLTGRTHQIRVHLAHVGFPLLGDKLYGGAREFMGIQIAHPLLHSAALEFEWPKGVKNKVEAEPSGIFWDLLKLVHFAVDG